ncbi:hypothetical protein GCM10008018_29500 [Paenibacillus marchantiophytorum]|uniref:DUF1800 domain-containing protein n=1 Tax=Paenibacillus marchantiophytorum TaxID=1619310 RepID=A0ABQ1EPV2_9BACL|nr:DUF1800 domain-containing protein [Paenibacillus marchantiophytorum]GFZ81898.1 hypothetical protein GCM10008018_29500 [Paenibacillus marchantiophytorum]
MGLPWTNKEVVHLLLRAGFGATQEEIAACVSHGPEETVRRLIAGESVLAQTTALIPFDQLTADGKKALDPLQLADQQMYWLYRMVYSEAPLVEKMTLFWHGHFATANYKVNDVTLMVQQNTLLRKYAMGKFQELLLAISQDPAMMIWLDVNRNKKGKPNENYAREVMELFTLGIGHYTENDVKEAARAFTGWTYDKKENKVAFNPKQHDNDAKQLLGEKGNLDSADAVDIIVHQKTLSTFLATKLLKYFATDIPSESWVQQIAAHIVNKATIGEVLHELFLSAEFYEEKYRMALIKTPADYVAGILKALQLSVSKGHAQALRKMGQELYSPPDVAGWRGGTSWLNTNTLLARYQFAESIAKQMNLKLLTAPAFTPEQASHPDEWVKLWSQRLAIANLSDKTLQGLSSYADDTIVHTKQKNTGLRGLLQLVLISPEAQMK